MTYYADKHIKAWHINMPLCVPVSTPVDSFAPAYLMEPCSYYAPKLLSNPLIYLSTWLDASAQARLKKSNKWRTTGNGYFLEQSTKPQTIGYSLADSPVGLLAWIYEKLVEWTDDYPWTEDEGERISI